MSALQRITFPGACAATAHGQPAARWTVQPAQPRPWACMAPHGVRPHRLTPATWPAIALPGHAERRAEVERDTLPDLLLALREHAWPLRLGWPAEAGWQQPPLVLTDVRAAPGGWLLRWHRGALWLPDAMLARVWRLARQRRDGLQQHLLVCDALGRPALLLSPAAGAARCGWQGLLDAHAPWQPAVPAARAPAPRPR